MSGRVARALGPLRQPWVLITLALCAIAVGLGLVAQETEESRPLHPDSAEPDGTLGLVLTLRELGADVEVGEDPPDEGVDTAILLRDTLFEPDREELREWVGAGGTLLLTDPSSDVTQVAPTQLPGLGSTVPLRRDCDLPTLAAVPRLDNAGGMGFLPTGGTPCYVPATSADPSQGAWMLVQPLGAGTVVRVGGPEPFLNNRLDESAFATLAAALLWPEERATVRFVFSETSLLVTDDGQGAGLTDLVPQNVRTALWQLVAAFVVFAIWRGRRLGQPVTEPQPVELPASELVVSVGNVLQRAGRHADAAGILADDLRRRLAERLGLPASSTPEQVAETVAARTGIERERVLQALTPVPPADEHQLLGRSKTIAEIQREVTRVR